MVPKALQIWSRGREILLCEVPKAMSPLLRGSAPSHHLLSHLGDMYSLLCLQGGRDLLRLGSTCCPGPEGAGYPKSTEMPGLE